MLSDLLRIRLSSLLGVSHQDLTLSLVCKENSRTEAHCRESTDHCSCRNVLILPLIYYFMSVTQTACRVWHFNRLTCWIERLQWIGNTLVTDVLRGLSFKTIDKSNVSHPLNWSAGWTLTFVEIRLIWILTNTNIKLCHNKVYCWKTQNESLENL